jgi:hypothetical protein
MHEQNGVMKIYRVHELQRKILDVCLAQHVQPKYVLNSKFATQQIDVPMSGWGALTWEKVLIVPNCQ